MLVRVFDALFCARDAGAARTRSSLRPLFFRRDNEMKNFGRTAPRE
jgi:hypothetical protein